MSATKLCTPSRIRENKPFESGVGSDCCDWGRSRGSNWLNVAARGCWSLDGDVVVATAVVVVVVAPGGVAGAVLLVMSAGCGCSCGRAVALVVGSIGVGNCSGARGDLALASRVGGLRVLALALVPWLAGSWGCSVDGGCGCCCSCGVCCCAGADMRSIIADAFSLIFSTPPRIESATDDAPRDALSRSSSFAL
jgi:hypothetical protein